MPITFVFPFLSLYTPPPVTILAAADAPITEPAIRPTLNGLSLELPLYWARKIASTTLSPSALEAILSKISNISKWKQICARIIRTKSHVALPKNRRYANIYTMIIHHPDEKGFLYEQKYYILRRKLNRSIEEYINDIEKSTIGYKLFNDPRSIESDEKERKDLIDMYCKDISIIPIVQIA